MARPKVTGLRSVAILKVIDRNKFCGLNLIIGLQPVANVKSTGRRPVASSKATGCKSVDLSYL